MSNIDNTIEPSTYRVFLWKDFNRWLIDNQQNEIAILLENWIDNFSKFKDHNFTKHSRCFVELLDSTTFWKLNYDWTKDGGKNVCPTKEQCKWVENKLN